jgi:hypothetical protein
MLSSLQKQLPPCGQKYLCNDATVDQIQFDDDNYLAGISKKYPELTAL